MVEIFGYKFFEDEAPKTVVKKVAKPAISPEKPKKIEAPKKNIWKSAERRNTISIEEKRQRDQNKVLIGDLVYTIIYTPDQVNFLLNRDVNKYSALVGTEFFQRQVEDASQNVKFATGETKTKYIILLQLQAKFKYGYDDDIDGIRWKSCDETIARLQSEKAEKQLRAEVMSPLTRLTQLVKSKDSSKIAEDLRNNKDKYRAYVQSPLFEQQLADAIANPQKNALILQLYGRFVLNDTSILVDGIYGAQTRSIIERYMERVNERSVNREERLANRQRAEVESQTRQQEITTVISQRFVESLTPEDNARYSKIFELPESTIESLISQKEKRNKTPEQIAALCIKRQNILSEKAIKSATSGCINYLQQLFNQTIQIDGGQKNFESALQKFDANRDTEPHDQSLDFKVTIDGKQLSLCYNMIDGTLSYSPLFLVNAKTWDLEKESPSLETSLVTAKIPSIASLLEEAKSWVLVAAQWKDNNRKDVKNAIKQIEIPPVDMSINQKEVAKVVAKESCMKTFLDLTWYNLTQDLPKTAHENDQLYVLYDMLNRTFNNPNARAEDIYHLKYLLEKFQIISNNYKDPTKVMVKNNRNDQFSIEKTTKEKIDLVLPKLGAEPWKSLSFYTLFSQYVNPKLNITDANYRILDTKKIEADLLFYDTHSYLSDEKVRGTIVLNEEEKDKIEADNMLKNLS